MAKRVSRLIAGVGMAAMVAIGAGGTDEGLQAAGSASANVTVTASVAANCVINAGSVVFGTYDPVSSHAAADLDAAGNFQVQCTKGTVATVTLGNGSNYSGGTRRMSNGSDFLNYNLYTSSGRATVWDSTNTVGYTAASKALHTLDVFGRVPQNQDVSTGSYTDTVQATINF